ncbi:rRNA-processing protein las1 [Savitreella phatthalungensis]
MAKTGYRVVPWRDKAEWLELRSAFYHASAQSQTTTDATVIDSRVTAINKVNAWRLRGRVPHAVESTCMLTCAVVGATSRPQLDSCLMMSAALVRFVNGLVDPAQQGVYAMSMMQLARSIGLPEYFVEIRHSATHEELPSYRSLLAATESALDWLYANYWEIEYADDHTRPPSADSAINETEERSTGLTYEVRGLLQAWRSLRKDLVKLDRPLTSGDQDPTIRAAWSLVRDADRHLRSPDGARVFVNELLSDEFLLKRVSASLSGRDPWSPLMDSLIRNPGFARNFALKALALLLVDDIPATTTTQTRPKVAEATTDRLQQYWLACISAHSGSTTGTSEITREVLRELALAKGPDIDRCVDGPEAPQAGAIVISSCS